MIKFSVVMPVKDESKFLPYSLPSVFGLHPDEVILLFDDCGDGSVEVARRITLRQLAPDGCEVQFVEVGECDWRFRPAFLRRLGFKHARNDVILSTDADIVLDSEIKRFFGLVGAGVVAHVGFEVVDFPVNFRCCLKRLLEFLRVPASWLSQAYLFSRQAWMETEKQEGLESLEWAEDTHLLDCIRRKYRTRLVLSGCLHLRPVETADRHYLRGRMYWTVARRSLLLTVLSGLLLFRPWLMVGYIRERWG